jgi:hypothetical protein
MTTTSAERRQLANRGEESERLETVERLDGMAIQLWQDVQDEVQQVLAELDDAVRQCVPDLETEAGKTQARHFSLFAYRTFSRSGKAIDPVVAGLTFVQSRENDENRVTIEADISGEETGDILLSVPRRTIPLAPEQLIHAAREMAAQLARNSRRIADALLDPSRQVR